MLFAALLMQGCSKSIDVALFGLPDELKHCAPEPMPPQHSYNSLQAAQYIVDLRDAGRDCRQVVQQINSIF